MSTSLHWRLPTKWHNTGIQGSLKNDIASKLSFDNVDFLAGVYTALEPGETRNEILRMLEAIRDHGEIEVCHK